MFLFRSNAQITFAYFKDTYWNNSLSQYNKQLDIEREKYIANTQITVELK